MRPIQRIISVGFATAAIAAASMPALSWTVWPDVDFEWYANVGRPAAAATQATMPAREGDEGLARDESRSFEAQAAIPQDSSDRTPPTSQAEGRRAPTLPDSELVSPTLPYSGSNRR